MQLIQDLEHIQNDDALPDKNTSNHLPVAFVTHQDVLRVPADSTATLNVTHSRQIHQAQLEQQEQELPPVYRSSPPRTTAYRGLSRYHQPYQHAPCGQGRSPQHSHNRAIQCEACGTNGHVMEVCIILPRVYAFMEYIAARPTAALEATTPKEQSSSHASTKQRLSGKCSAGINSSSPTS